MNKLLKITLYVIITILVLLGGLVSYVSFFLPNTGPAPDISVELTPEKIERGNYLANHVTVCMDCHTLRDWSKYSGPPVEELLGSGGEVFNQDFGFPGRFISKNITPFALADWTDGEIFRAITSGVDRDGKPIFPVMPYTSYSTLDREDIYAIIAYIRSLEPVESVLEPSKPDFPINIIMNTMPVKPQLTERPPATDKVRYGEYMVRASACADCHTNARDGKIIGEYMAGGFEFNMGNGTVVRSLNITPHPVSGIGSWSKEQFVQTFRSYTDSLYVPHEVDMDTQEFQTVMPWIMYGGMTEKDLGAIYEYLMTIPAVDNTVERFSVISPVDIAIH